MLKSTSGTLSLSIAALARSGRRVDVHLQCPVPLLLPNFNTSENSQGRHSRWRPLQLLQGCAAVHQLLALAHYLFDHSRQWLVRISPVWLVVLTLFVVAYCCHVLDYFSVGLAFAVSSHYWGADVTISREST